MDFIENLKEQKSLWEYLQSTQKPIVIYGMGNGGDKLIERLDFYHIPYEDIFASDEFVRGQFFHGKQVLKYTDVKVKYKDPIILIAFATRFDEVLSRLEKLDETDEIYIPDLPVAGDTLFTKEFLLKHETEIRLAHELFSDEFSKKLYENILLSKYTGKLKPLLEYTSTKEEMYQILDAKKIHTFADLGAYTGDTFEELHSYSEKLTSGVLLEPDEKSFKKLVLTKEKLGYKDEIKLVNAAAWNEDTDGVIYMSSNRNSTLVATTSYQHKEKKIAYKTLDNEKTTKLDYIKYDVEGSEWEALKGSQKTISNDHPKLLVSLYHKTEDLFQIPPYLKQNYPFYNFYLRRVRCTPAWEINLLCIPKESEGQINDI